MIVDLIDMKPLYDFVVHISRKVNDSVEVGGQELFLDTRFDEFAHRVSVGTIVATPLKFDTPAEVGDTLIFHHHINMEDKYCIDREKQHYVVTFDPDSRSCHAFGVIKPSGEIITLASWVFLDAPEEKKEEEKSESGLFLGYVEPDTTNTEGVVKAKNMYIEDIAVGDTVGFRENADYRIRLPEPHGDIFRMHIDDVYYVKV